MLNFFKKSIKDVVNQTKLVKICGIYFRIKKIDAFDYASGSNVMLSTYATYEDASALKKQEVSMKKIKEHYKDVFLSSVVEPKLLRKKDQSEDEGLLVDNLFTEPELVESLYTAILTYTYGKKKLTL